MAHLSAKEKAEIAGKSARELYGKEMRKKGYGKKTKHPLSLGWWNEITGVGDSAAPFPASHFPESRKAMEDWLHKHTGLEQSYTWPDVSSRKTTTQKRKNQKNKKRKPTRPKIAEKSAARAEKIQRRKRGGKVWSGNDFVREVNNYKEI